MRYTTSVRQRWGARLFPSLSLATALGILAAACASNPDPDHRVGVETRFAIEVTDASHPPVVVQATSESRPVAWLRVLQDGRPVYVEERCDVPDCDAPGAVCGANIPTVRQIAAEDEAGSIAYTWDGTRSVISEEAPRCERREAAPPGDYVVRFCYGHSADARGDPRSDSGAMGRLTDPICVDRSFQFGDAEVVLRIP